MPDRTPNPGEPHRRAIIRLPARAGRRTVVAGLVTAILLAVLPLGLASSPASAAGADPQPCADDQDPTTCIPKDQSTDGQFPLDPIAADEPVPDGSTGELVYPLHLPWPNVPACRSGFGGYLYDVPCARSSFSVMWWNSTYQVWSNGGYNYSIPNYGSVDGPTSELRVGASTPRLTFLVTSTISQINNRYDRSADTTTITHGTFEVGVPAAGPHADFLVTDRGSGSVDFSSQSTDPRNRALFESWNFGDGSPAINGSVAVHTYTAPGTFTVTLTSTNTDQQTATATKQVTIDAPQLSADIVFLDGVVPPLDPTEPVKVEVTARASDDGVGNLNNLRFDSDQLVTASPANVFSLVDGPTPAFGSTGFSLAPGGSKAFIVTLQPEQVGRYDLAARVSGTDALGRAVTADADSPGVIGEALKIDITLDPPDADQEEGPDGPEPVDVTATLRFTNTTDVDMTTVTLTSLRVDRTESGQLLAVEQTGGADPGDDGLAIGALAPGAHKEVTATFRATDDAEVEFSALARASLSDGREEVGLGKQHWSVKPKYLLSLTSQVTNPAGTAVLPAGETVRITGRVKNLSTSATVEVGPLYPTLVGNGGAMSLTWDDVGVDPRDLTTSNGFTLEPSESKTFSVRILTGYSDPADAAGKPKPSGGTKLTASFTPWARVTFEDGTERLMLPDELKTTDDDLSHRIAIDDSIAIPTFDVAAYGGAVLVGGVEGIWSGSCMIVTGLYDLAKAPYTVIMGTAAIQAQVWDSFSDEEKTRFADDSAYLAASILMRNGELAKDGFDALLPYVQKSTYDAMVEMENNWRIGDYTTTVQLWSRYGGDAIAQVAVPMALGKLAKAPATATALNRSQKALQTKMAPLLARAGRITEVEEMVPVLEALESGTQLQPAELAQLFGITEEEYAELKKIVDELGILMTVRSRNETSIQWIQRAQALLKPEVLKIKTVSPLDIKLGYPQLEGSLVFRKPEVLILYEKGGSDLRPLLDQFVRSKGIDQYSAEYWEAVQRIMDRMAEWQKWEKTYQQWSARGWIDTSINYKGNAIADLLHPGRSAQDVAPLSIGRYEGFRLRPLAEGEGYAVEMYNNKARAWVPVTGDIDPIALTHMDGTALTMAEHLAALQRMISNPLLQSKHGESATFTKGGVKFIQSQFKPNEPGLMIAPGDNLPRVVRLDAESGKSRWESPFDYNLNWFGGFKYSGSYVPRTANPQLPQIVPAPATAAKALVQPLPAAVSSAANVGRCRITYGTGAGALHAVIDTNGRISTLTGSPTENRTEPSPLHDQCFSPGPPIEVEVAPMTGLAEEAASGETELAIPEADSPWFGQAGTDLRVGDQVTVGAGGPNAETRTIVAFGSIIIDQPLDNDHEAGEAIVVTQAVPRAGPTTPTTPTTEPVAADPSPAVLSPDPAPAVQPIAAEAMQAPDPAAAASTGQLPSTGGNTVPIALLALGLVAAGVIALRAERSTHRGRERT